MNIVQGYRVLWTGVGAQLARDVPFSAICWATLEPVRLHGLHFNPIFFFSIFFKIPIWFNMPFQILYVQLMK